LLHIPIVIAQTHPDYESKANFTGSNASRFFQPITFDSFSQRIYPVTRSGQAKFCVTPGSLLTHLGSDIINSPIIQKQIQKKFAENPNNQTFKNTFERAIQNITNIQNNIACKPGEVATFNATAPPMASALDQNITANNLTKMFGNKTDTFNGDANHIQEASAHLHNDDVTYGKLVSEDSLLICIDQVFFHSKTYLNATELDKDNCDVNTVNDIKEHTFADNQTMIRLAYAYLNARGIH
jgi:hypothetical protein